MRTREFEDGVIVPGTRYLVRGLVGVGGMGSVYEVEHVELGKRFVLKALLRELAPREDLVARLRTEWRALARLEHPCIVAVTDAGTTADGVPFYVMERLEGETLSARLRRLPPLSLAEALDTAAGLLEGLAAAHEIGIVHRDVKPANVFLLAQGGVKVLDFGVAKVLHGTAAVVTARGIAVGTPRYMSPEQVRGDRVDGRADLYAVGLLLFEMIGGRGPFDDIRDTNELLLAHVGRAAPRLGTIAAGVPREVDEIVASLLAKEPAERPARAREVGERLRRLAARYATTSSTDALTAVARYDAPTLHVRRAAGAPHASGRDAGAPGPSTTAPGTPTRAEVPRGATLRLDDASELESAPTDPMSAPPESPALRTPSGTTQPLGERQRTQRLDELAPAPGPFDEATRTSVPAPDGASRTPPPVVARPAQRDAAAPASPLVRRVGFAAAILGAAIAGALLALGAIGSGAAAPAPATGGIGTSAAAVVSVAAPPVVAPPAAVSPVPSAAPAAGPEVVAAPPPSAAPRKAKPPGRQPVRPVAPAPPTPAAIPHGLPGSGL
ncbi:MAG: protein kinase [Polyangiaceae bacterium]|nr:protein kinase [Polyangiaceae bacterium]